jgi:hypothetical protein
MRQHVSVALLALSGDVLTFEVALPEPCTDACADAYAWALSAFASGPWERLRCPRRDRGTAVTWSGA